MNPNKVFLPVDLINEAWYALFTVEPGDGETMVEHDTGVIAQWDAEYEVFIDESGNSFAHWDIAVRQA